MRESVNEPHVKCVPQPPAGPNTLSVLPLMVRPTASVATAPPSSRLMLRMFVVSLPNQMPKLWVPALAVYSASSVGMLDAEPGEAEAKIPAELCPVSTLTWPAPNRLSATVCRLASPAGGALMTDGTDEFGTSGSAEDATLAVRPNNATIDFIFIENCRRSVTPSRVISAGQVNVGSRDRAAHRVRVG